MEEVVDGARGRPSCFERGVEVPELAVVVSIVCSC